MKEVLRSFMARPIGVSMLAISVLIAGGLAAQSLPLARLPELGLPCVLVEASMPGFPAAEVRSLVAMPLEEALSALKGLRSCSSVSRDGRALLRLDFSWGSAPSLCASRTREALDRAFMVLPHGASRPVAIPYDPSREALLVLAVTPLGSDMTAAKRLAERELSARLRRIAGAGRVAILGGFQPEYVVSVDLERSAARGLDLNEVAASVAAASADVPAGTLRQGPREMPVVARGRIERIEDLRSLTLPGRDASYSLDDIASIREEPGERKSLFMRGAEEAVGIELYASPGADPVKLARLARNAALEMCDDFGSDFAITVVHDSSRGVSRAIRGLAVSALLGAAAAAAALCLFFRDLRSGALAMGVMPLAGAASLCVLALAGRSLNAMSLGGLALSMGMVSDNAVLVLSALSSPRARARGKEGGEARLEALLSVMGGSFGSAMTTVIVFLPVAFLPGILGALFGDLAISLVSAVLAGWVAAVFLLPALHQVFGGHSQGRGEPECARPKLAFLEERYRYALRKAMRRPRATLSLAAMAAFVGCLFFFAMPVSFLDGQNQR